MENSSKPSKYVPPHRRGPPPPPPEPPKRTATPLFRVAFLFLVINDINNPEIWDNYFQGHEDAISIYCHPKNPENVKTEWLKQNIIHPIVHTEWGRITNAYFHLIHTALQNPENQKFIVISESCIPVQSFDRLYSRFLAEPIQTSYIKLFPFISDYDESERIGQKNIQGRRWTIDEAREQGFIVNSRNRDGVPVFLNADGSQVPYFKHYARFCLSRNHATQLFKNSNLQEMFNQMSVGDEFFLSIINKRENTPHIWDFAITFDNWDRVNKEKYLLKKRLNDPKTSEEEKVGINHLLETTFSGANPYTYTTVDEEDVEEVIRQGSFFWRKFPTNSPVSNFFDRRGNPHHRRRPSPRRNMRQWGGRRTQRRRRRRSRRERRTRHSRKIE